jgi:hypothetical protein
LITMVVVIKVLNNGRVKIFVISVVINVAMQIAVVAV